MKHCGYIQRRKTRRRRALVAAVIIIAAILFALGVIAHWLVHENAAKSSNRGMYIILQTLPNIHRSFSEMEFFGFV